MTENIKPKKHRHRRHYTIMVVSGDSDAGSGSFHLGHVATQILAFSLFAILVAIICFIIATSINIKNLKENSAIQLAQIQELEETNATLAATNSELQSEVTQLSQALNQKVEVEEQTAAEAEEQSMPTQLPILDGTATMVNTYDDPNSAEITLPDENADAEEAKDEAENTGDEDGESTEETTAEEETGNPILILQTAEGSTIVSSGAGTVTQVAADVKYGNSISIDHGNGYVSIYRNQGDCLVHEGDEVTRGTTLYVVGESNTTLGYQLTYEGEYIDPETLIEING